MIEVVPKSHKVENLPQVETKKDIKRSMEWPNEVGRHVRRHLPQSEEMVLGEYGYVFTIAN